MKKFISLIFLVLMVGMSAAHADLATQLPNGLDVQLGLTTDTFSASSTTSITGAFTASKSWALSGEQIVSVSASATTNITPTASFLIIKNAETIGTANIVLPSSPRNGQIVVISPVAAITVATITAGGTTVKNGVTAFTAGTPVGYIYSSAETAWFRSR